jgi:hypothetical protein
MKLAAAGLLPCLAFVATAQKAYLYNLDLNGDATSSSIYTSIDSETANAILARRLGGTEALSLGRADEDLLQHLNQYGGQQDHALFQSEDESSANRLVLALQGYDGALKLDTLMVLSTQLTLCRRRFPRASRLEYRQGRHQSCEC